MCAARKENSNVCKCAYSAVDRADTQKKKASTVQEARAAVAAYNRMHVNLWQIKQPLLAHGRQQRGNEGTSRIVRTPETAA